jgi:hypothetical protein
LSSSVIAIADFLRTLAGFILIMHMDIVGLAMNRLQLLHVSIYFNKFISVLMFLFADNLDILKQRRAIK